MNIAHGPGLRRPISLLIGGTVTLGLALAGAGCSTSGTTCDEYAGMELFKQGHTLIDMLAAHGLDKYDISLNNALEYQINAFCGGPFKPQGGDRARKNGSRSIDEGVIWSKLG